MRVVLPIEELEPPWIIDEDILSASGAPLVLRGAVVTSSLKSAMLRHGIASIRVRTSDEGASSVGVLPSELRIKVRQSVQNLVTQTVRDRAVSPKLLSKVIEHASLVVDSLFSGTVPVFSELRSLSSYDAYTYEHSWSVMLFSVVLARAAWETGSMRALDYQSRVNLGVGAVLHDIGKTLVPSSILNKSGPLGEKEWEQMRLHPQNGFDLLRPYHLLMPMVRAIVAFHHERPDGKGYGLAKGATLDRGEIPELVRIVSIADAYDAITSSRPYRKGRLPFEALEILVTGAGSQFDPDLVGLMERIVVPFPSGALLLLTDGSIASVSSPGGFGGCHPEPECMVVASFASGGRRRPGESFKLEDLSGVALGGTSPGDLLGRIVEDAAGNSFVFAENGDLFLHSALPLWEDLFKNALVKIGKNPPV